MICFAELFLRRDMENPYALESHNNHKRNKKRESQNFGDHPALFYGDDPSGCELRADRENTSFFL